MISFGRFGTGSFLACLLALAGCSSESMTFEDPFRKPAGCTESFCDVQYDRCYGDARSGSSSQCGECASICSGSVDGSCVSSCLAACQGGSLPSVDHCNTTLQQCRSTIANRGCADGVDKYSVPRAVPSTTPPFMPPVDAHQGVCSEEEISYFEETCLLTGKPCKNVRAACRACLVVDESADRWGPFVRRGDGSMAYNSEGCVASLGDSACAAKAYAASECHHAACPYPDHTCSDLATAVSCAPQEEAAKCIETLYRDPAFSACFQPLVVDGVQKNPVPRFFCGK